MSSFNRVVISEGETGADAPTPDNNQLLPEGEVNQPIDNPSDQAPEVGEPTPLPERPEALPEKFKSIEDLAKAYSELEKKLSTPKQEAKSETPTEGKPDELVEQVKEGEEAEAPPADVSKTDLTPFHQEWDEKGELSPESFDKLEQMGLPKDLVRQYINGFQATQERETQAMYKETGGEESYTAMTKWAVNNLTAGEITAYDALVSSGDINTAKMAVKGLYAQYTQVNGKAPQLIGGNATGRSSVQEFRSTQEVVKAMSDPRYANDSAYRKDVERRLEMSSVL
jgi:hypothetical protein